MISREGNKKERNCSFKSCNTIKGYLMVSDILLLLRKSSYFYLKILTRLMLLFFVFVTAHWFTNIPIFSGRKMTQFLYLSKGTNPLI